MALSCGTKIVKYLLFLFNLIIWLCGVVLLGIGVWILSAHANAAYYLHIANLDYGLIQASAITIVVVGSLIFFVGALGCCGACRENNSCLTGFAFMLIVLLIIQIAAVIMAGVLHSQILTELGKAMNKTMVNNYGQTNQELVTESWNFMQIEMQCCGVFDEENGPAEWQSSKWYNDSHVPVPDSCCVELVNARNYTNPKAKDPTLCYSAAANSSMADRSSIVHVKGCEPSLNDWFMDSLAVLIGGTTAIIIIQIIVVIMACVLKSNIASSYETI
jgi:hypothetical protein